MLKRLITVGCLMFLALAVRPARAQGPDGGKPAVYTYIAEWAVPRDQWRDMAKASADEKVMMDKLVADGTIIGYGDFTTLLHQEGQPTHGSWFTATSRGGLLKALEAVYTLPQVTSPVMGASKHWDFLVASRMHGEKSGKFSGGYLAGGGFDVKPGQQEIFSGLMKKNFMPVLEKLLAEGTVTSYSVDTEDYHSQTPGRVTLVYTITDAADVDKVEDALESALMNDPALESVFRSAVDWNGHKDFLARVSNMVNK
jgi:hypothetical protein